MEVVLIAMPPVECKRDANKYHQSYQDSEADVNKWVPLSAVCLGGFCLRLGGACVRLRLDRGCVVLGATAARWNLLAMVAHDGSWCLRHWHLIPSYTGRDACVVYLVSCSVVVPIVGLSEPLLIRHAWAVFGMDACRVSCPVRRSCVEVGTVGASGGLCWVDDSLFSHAFTSAFWCVEQRPGYA